MNLSSYTSSSKVPERLTIEKIRESIDQVNELVKNAPPKINFVANDMMCKGKPKMQLSANVPVSDAFRMEMDAWMREFFGYHPDEIFTFTDPITNVKTVVTTERNARLLEAFNVGGIGAW